MLGIILNQGIVIIALLGLVFASFYFLQNKDSLRDLMHYSFSANLNYYATMKWTYLSNLFFFIPFIGMFFQLDLMPETEMSCEGITTKSPVYNFNMTMVMSKEVLENFAADINNHVRINDHEVNQNNPKPSKTTSALSG